MRFRSWPLLVGAFSSLLLLVGLSGMWTLRKSEQFYNKLSELDQAYRRVEKSLREIRSGVHISSLLVRDYLLDPSYLRSEHYRSEMLRLRQEGDQQLDQLARSEERENKVKLQQLSREVDAYWTSLDPIFEWNPE